MNQIKAIPLNNDRVYGRQTIYSDSDEIDAVEDYVAISQSDLDLLLDFKFRYESCQD